MQRGNICEHFAESLLLRVDLSVKKNKNNTKKTTTTTKITEKDPSINRRAIFKSAREEIIET